MADFSQLPVYANLVDRVHALPSIGRKTADKIAYHIIEMSDQDVERLVQAIQDAHQRIHRCSVCGNYTDKDVCSICSDPSRDASTICVVTRPRDIIPFDKSRELNCKFHVLHGLLSPMEGITPDMLTIDQLINRIKNGDVKEVIMATDPSVSGEATAMFISKLIKPLGVRVTRLGYGISIGTDLQYADTMTISRSIQYRNEL